MRPYIMLPICFLSAILISTRSYAQIPDWVTKDWNERVLNSPWTASNEKYQSDTETIDAYGMEWHYGLGASHLLGELFAIEDGERIGSIWKFTEYWDPTTKTYRVMQIGSDGTIGNGTVELDDEGQMREHQRFTMPDGNSFEVGHLVWTEDEAKHIQSYDIINGEWSERRIYVWKPTELATEPDDEVPDIFDDLSHLVGEWRNTFDEDRTAKMIFRWGKELKCIHYENWFKPTKEKSFAQENEGVILFHGVKNTWIFSTTYFGSGHLIAEGEISIDDQGTITRIFDCHYPPGDGLPWSNGKKAGPDGKTITFRQIWTMVDSDTIEGSFAWFKDGVWENPMKKTDKEVWRRVKE